MPRIQPRHQLLHFDSSTNRTNRQSIASCSTSSPMVRNLSRALLLLSPSPVVSLIINNWTPIYINRYSNCFVIPFLFLPFSSEQKNHLFEKSTLISVSFFSSIDISWRKPIFLYGRNYNTIYLESVIFLLIDGNNRKQD